MPPAYFIWFWGRLLLTPKNRKMRSMPVLGLCEEVGSKLFDETGSRI